MPNARIDPASFLPLTNLSFHVLLALGDGPAHGYAIGKDVEQRSRGRLNPATGSLYQALRRDFALRRGVAKLDRRQLRDLGIDRGAA